MCMYQQMDFKRLLLFNKQTNKYQGNLYSSKIIQYYVKHIKNSASSEKLLDVCIFAYFSCVVLKWIISHRRNWVREIVNGDIVCLMKHAWDWQDKANVNMTLMCAECK